MTTDTARWAHLKLLLGALLVGVGFDVLLMTNEWGVSYPLFVGAFYIIFFTLFWSRVKKASVFSWFLFGIITLLSATYLLFLQKHFHFFNFFIIPLLMVTHTLLVSGVAKRAWWKIGFVGEVLEIGFNHVLPNLLKPFKIVFDSLGGLLVFKNNPVLKKVGAGIALSIPLLVIVVGLLASADEVFQRLIADIFDSVDMKSIDLLLEHGVVVGLVTAFVCSYFWTLAYFRSRHEEIAIQDPKRSWDPITVVTVLTLLNLVYVVFAVIQFSYLFGGALESELTYSEYARRGFFELLQVSVLNLLILISSLTFTKASSGKIRVFMKSLLAVMVAATFVLLYSSHFRLSLYEMAYGYTHWRVFPHVFMLLLIAFLGLALWKIKDEQFPLLKYGVVASLVWYVGINYMNVDAFIARQNVERYFEIGKIDQYYLSQLSFDAVPELMKLQEHEISTNEEIMDREGRVLYTKHNSPSFPLLSKFGYRLQEEVDLPWQAFNLSREKAKELLEVK